MNTAAACGSTVIMCRYRPIRTMSVKVLPKKLVHEVLQSSSDALVVTDSDGAIVYVNDESELLFGYNADEMLGKPVEILMPASHRERHKHIVRGFHEAPRARPLLSGMELYGCRKDGSKFRAEIALTPVETKKGLFVASTIRKRELEDQADSNFRALLENAPDAMIIVDRDGRIAIVNGQTEKMFGYQRDEMIGRRIEMLLPDALHAVHREHRANYVANPELRPMGIGRKLIARRKDGSEFPVEISLSPTRTVTGQFIWSVIRDVTERKRMEGEIIAARQEAERANKANSAFLAAASHDLRQPVQALHLLNGALRRTVTDARALEMIDSQEQSLTAMTNLLNSLLDISRLDAGAVAAEVDEFPVQRLIDRLSSEFSRQARQKGLYFSSGSCGAVVRTDPNLLAEIIQNFVSNAIRYTEAGSVRLDCEQKDGVCRLRVTDTGIGIEPDQRDEIFREFHQIARSTPAKEGFGLGLAIVRRLADLLDHELGVESTPGQGSQFWIAVPVVSDASVAATEAAAADLTLKTRVSGLVILIEDDVSVTRAWKMLLEAEGYEVATAASATDAAQLLEQLDDVPALLISDFHLLDGSTGVEAVARIREHYGANIPAFVISGDTSKVVKDARMLDNCTLMNKPVDTDGMLDAARIATRTGRVPDG